MFPAHSGNSRWFWFAVFAAVLALGRVGYLLVSSPPVAAPASRIPGTTAAVAPADTDFDPASAASLLALSRRLEQAGKRDDAAAAVRAAVRLRPADRAVLVEAARFFMRTGSTEHALLALRRVVDLYPHEAAAVWPTYIELMGNGIQNEFFVTAARSDPPWWRSFFDYACTHAPDTAGLQRLLMIRFNDGAATEEERRCAVARLQRDGQWTVAYQLWLNTLPPRQRVRVGYVFNGNFEYPISNTGFDWSLPEDETAVATVAPLEQGEHALQLAFMGRRYDISSLLLHQYLLLSPGSYRLSFRTRADALESPAGLRWGLFCVEGMQESRMLLRTDRFFGSYDWTGYGYDFRVPEHCAPQILRLELVAPPDGEKTRMTGRVRGVIHFHNITARRIE